MKKGFTLIELLAVIVILAIIALIATPIVLNIINDSKESARLRSADFYLDAVEYSISKRMQEGKMIEDGVYNILESGNICVGVLEDNTCKGEILEVEVNGERPNGDKITIKDGQIVSHVIKYGDIIIQSESDGVVPDGAIYMTGYYLYRETDSSQSSVHYAYKTILRSGDPMPATPQKGDMYYYGEYEYCYGIALTLTMEYENYMCADYPGAYWAHLDWQLSDEDGEPIVIKPSDLPTINGWSVRYQGGDNAGDILDRILDKPIIDISGAFASTTLKTAPKIPSTVTNMEAAFAGCYDLKTAPIIPNGVTNMESAFLWCTSLEMAPEIPSSVTNMRHTFANCFELKTAPVIPKNVTNMEGTFASSWISSLTGEIVINANPSSYNDCFTGVSIPEQNITLSGTSSKLAELAATARAYE